jgi:hypothetical protein
MLRLKRTTTTNPLFYSERLRALLAHDPDRVERMRTDEVSVDLLTWNVFASLETDDDRDFLAGELRAFLGNDALPPVRLSLLTGRSLDPMAEPSSAYVAHIRAAAGDDADLAEFLAPIEVPVRIEARNVLGLVDTMIDEPRRGSGGRDRLIELIDAGLVQAERIGKPLAVAVVYRSGTAAAAEVSRRINELRRPDALAAALPWRARIPEVRLREVTWQQLIKMWENERRNLKLFNEPVRSFLSYAEQLGLR